MEVAKVNLYEFFSEESFTALRPVDRLTPYRVSGFSPPPGVMIRVESLLLYEYTLVRIDPPPARETFAATEDRLTGAEKEIRITGSSGALLSTPPLNKVPLTEADLTSNGADGVGLVSLSFLQPARRKNRLLYKK